MATSSGVRTLREYDLGPVARVPKSMRASPSTAEGISIGGRQWRIHKGQEQERRKKGFFEEVREGFKQLNKGTFLLFLDSAVNLDHEGVRAQCLGDLGDQREVARESKGLVLR